VRPEGSSRGPCDRQQALQFVGRLRYVDREVAAYGIDVPALKLLRPLGIAFFVLITVFALLYAVARLDFFGKRPIHILFLSSRATFSEQASTGRCSSTSSILRPALASGAVAFVCEEGCMTSESLEVAALGDRRLPVARPVG
jgi:hypothetical protein